ncbi:hypothetical protein ACOHYD_03285 [Desulfobacterota bacterium M19]
MTQESIPEVTLEICSGFFRIPTKDIIYNIKVISADTPSTTRVIEKIIEVEKAPSTPQPEPAVAAQPPPAVPPEPAAPVETPAVPAPYIDDYYQQALTSIGDELKQPEGEIPASWTATLNGLQDLSEMAAELQEVLKAINPVAADSESSGNSAAVIREVMAMINDAGSQTPVSTTTTTRYLFNFDAVFQTIYELCTNETVKEHVQKARARAEDIFDKNKFYDLISPKASSLKEDDGFLSFPMSDIFNSLLGSCSDKKTTNLLKKMDQQQADIFLDQFLPLEVPPTEEAVVSAPAVESKAPVDSTKLLSRIKEKLANLHLSSSNTGGGSDMTEAIGDAINIAASISYDAQEIKKTATVAGKFIGLPLRRIAVLIKELQEIKEKTPALTLAEGLTQAHKAADHFASRENSTLQEELAPEPEEIDDEDAGSGEASQDDIDRLLEEMG